MVKETSLSTTIKTASKRPINLSILQALDISTAARNNCPLHFSICCSFLKRSDNFLILKEGINKRNIYFFQTNFSHKAKASVTPPANPTRILLSAILLTFFAFTFTRSEPRVI